MHATSSTRTASSPMAFDDPLIGRTIAGKWRVEKSLGSGGMGSVYLARDLSIDRPVALKFLQKVLAAQPEYRARFEHEARVMAKVDHPNLVTLYGVEREGDVPFLVMKFVTGRTLAKLIKDQGKLTLAEVMPLLTQVVSALTALHSQGYVHRDLKPGNIMVSDDGAVTLLDFGLIRTRGQDLTQPGMALGSPFYMSPEQAVGQAVDFRSDLYTLGVVLTELLTGKRPFAETDAHASLLAHLERPPMAAHELEPSVPKSVSRVLLQALEKRPEDRQRSATELLEQLTEAGSKVMGGASSGRRPVLEETRIELAPVGSRAPRPSSSGGKPGVTRRTPPEPRLVSPESAKTVAGLRPVGVETNDSATTLAAVEQGPRRTDPNVSVPDVTPVETAPNVPVTKEPTSNESQTVPESVGMRPPPPATVAPWQLALLGVLALVIVGGALWVLLG